MLDPKIFEVRPGISAVLLPNYPDFTIIAISNDFVQVTGIPRSELIGKGFFEKFPGSPLDPEFTGAQNIRASLNYVLQLKTPHCLPLQRYDLQNSDGSFTEKYWKPYNVPVLSDTGELVYLIHTADDVTDTVKARQTQEANQKLEHACQIREESERKYRRLFESIDQGFCLVELIYDANGKPIDHLFLETNPVYEMQTGLKNVLGKTARQVSPGIEPRWFELYDEVARSGVPARFYEESEALGR